MSSPIDVMKEYLVSLGFSVDKQSFNTATKTIDSAGESLAKLAGGAVKNFAIAGGAVATFVAIAIEKIAKFITTLGNTQIQYEMLAHQMWTTQENAEAFSTTLQAMGRSLNDLYLSPTLMAQFEQLNKQAFEMMPPAEYQQQMKFIQDISFQFTRMKLEGTYALQWIGYYFIKYMAGPINNIKSTLSGVNDTIIKTMPYWTKVVAEVMSWFAQFGVTVVEADKAIIQEFNNIGDSIPKNIKQVGLALVGLLLIMNQGPIGWIIDGIVALGLALNDFFTYIHGGKSEFGSFWQKLIDLYDKLKDSGAIDNFKNGLTTAFKDISKFIDDAEQGVKKFYKALEKNGTIDNVVTTLQNNFDIIQTLTKDASGWFKSLYKTINKDGVIKDLTDDVASLFQAVTNVTSSVTGLLDKLLGLKGTQKAIKQVGDWLNNEIVNALLTIDTLLKQVASGINGLGDLMKGDWKDAWKNFKDIFTKDTSPMSKSSYIYPQSNKQTNNNSQVSVNNTQNIYGSSDPNATAAAAANNLTTVLRNAKGVIV